MTVGLETKAAGLFTVTGFLGLAKEVEKLRKEKAQLELQLENQTKKFHEEGKTVVEELVTWFLTIIVKDLIHHHLETIQTKLNEVTPGIVFEITSIDNFSLSITQLVREQINDNHYKLIVPVEINLKVMNMNVSVDYSNIQYVSTVAKWLPTMVTNIINPTVAINSIKFQTNICVDIEYLSKKNTLNVGLNLEKSIVNIGTKNTTINAILSTFDTTLNNQINNVKIPPKSVNINTLLTTFLASLSTAPALEPVAVLEPLPVSQPVPVSEPVPVLEPLPVLEPVHVLEPVPESIDLSPLPEHALAPALTLETLTQQLNEIERARKEREKEAALAAETLRQETEEKQTKGEKGEKGEEETVERPKIESEGKDGGEEGGEEEGEDSEFKTPLETFTKDMD